MVQNRKQYVTKRMIISQFQDNWMVSNSKANGIASPSGLSQVGVSHSPICKRGVAVAESQADSPPLYTYQTGHDYHQHPGSQTIR